MTRTKATTLAAVLGAAALTLAACGGSSTSSETAGSAAASAAAESAASEAAEEGSAAPAGSGIPLYLVDGNTGNALGEKLPAGTLNGVKGTIPGAENTEDFKQALLAIDPELKDFAYGPETYDAVVLAALAAAAAK